MKTAIVYRRVSTKRQGESGLGLEAQQQAVETYATANQIKLLATYTEVESGRPADGPDPPTASSHAKASKAMLIVTNLDRLARNVSFLSALMDSGVEFCAVDNANANRLTIHILVAVAEDEARRISQRTKDALAAYKA